MQYVPFGTLGFDVSRLGFGAMRLPRIEQDGQSVPDVERSIALIRAGIDGGITYVDTAYPYMGGESEKIVGRALRDGYRERVKLATKLPCWKVETRADMDRLLDEQLKKLDVPYVDFYLLHALDHEDWEKMQSLGVCEFLDSALRDGRIRHPAFSFHDQYGVFRRIMNSYDWHMAQIQFNYLDIREQAGLSGIRLARVRKVPLVIMEPLRGGALAKAPADVQEAIDAHRTHRSAVEWAFRYVGDFSENAVILSGMSNEEQLRDNLRIFDDIRPLSLRYSDKLLIARLRAIYRQRMPIPCTGCAYCVPCPQGVAIPRLFAAYNQSRMFDDPAQLLRRYRSLAENGGDASRCVQCGLCEEKCPQKLPIRQWLADVHKAAQSKP